MLLRAEIQSFQQRIQPLLVPAAAVISRMPCQPEAAILSMTRRFFQMRITGGGCVEDICKRYGDNNVSMKLSRFDKSGVVPRNGFRCAARRGAKLVLLRRNCFMTRFLRVREGKILRRRRGQEVGSRRNEYPQLSGGMKRRLMIAQALVHRPPVIVLDEPTAGVDINLRLSIRELNADGHTIILTTHYLEEAEALCRKLALMRGGKVVALDNTRNLLGDCVQVRLLVEGNLPDDLPPHRKRESGRMIFNTLTYCDIEPLLASLRQSGARITDLEVAPADLEDAFLRIVGNPV